MRNNRWKSIFLAGAIVLNVVIAPLSGTGTVKAAVDYGKTATDASPSPSPSVSPSATPGASPSTSPSASPSASATPGNTQQPLGTPDVPKITGVKMVAGTVRINATADYCEGAEYAIYRNKGNKQIDSKDTLYTSCDFVGVNRNQVYYARVRGYAFDNNYNRVYSEWSGKKYFVPQPQITDKSKFYRRGDYISLKWKKITGAKNYTIQLRKRNGGKWSKVKTLPAKKTSYKITRFKGKKLNLNSNAYEIRMTATAKAGGKTIKSDASEYKQTY